LARRLDTSFQATVLKPKVEAFEENSTEIKIHNWLVSLFLNPADSGKMTQDFLWLNG